MRVVKAASLGKTASSLPLVRASPVLAPGRGKAHGRAAGYALTSNTLIGCASVLNVYLARLIVWSGDCKQGERGHTGQAGGQWRG